MTKLLVLDNYESFSLVPYLRTALPEVAVVKMGNIYTDQMWDIFCGVDPDVVFVDFCDTNMQILSHKVDTMKRKPKIVGRLHGFEAQQWFLDKVKWENVSELVVVSPKFQEIVASRIGGVVRVNCVRNGVDLNHFKLQDESDMDINHIAYLGYLNKKKGPTLLRTVFMSWPEKKFSVGGTFQDEHVKRYFLSIPLSNVYFNGWVDSKEFLKGKRFVLSTSVTESFGMSIAEGMATGLTPLVHEWPGADQLWPHDCIWTTIDQLKEIEPKDPAWCRKWISDRYPIGLCVEKISRLLID